MAMDKIAGYLEVGLNDRGEVVINVPAPKPGLVDADGTGHLVFSPRQAMTLGELLIRRGVEAAKQRGEWPFAMVGRLACRETLAKEKMERDLAAAKGKSK